MLGGKWRRIERANWYWVNWTKRWSWKNGNAIEMRWLDLYEEVEEDIALSNFTESLQKQLDEQNLSKK